MFTAVEPEYPWSHIPVHHRRRSCGRVPTTANVNQKRTTRPGRQTGGQGPEERDRRRRRPPRHADEDGLLRTSATDLLAVRRDASG